jgi:glucose/arabinose dehydrogenase
MARPAEGDATRTRQSGENVGMKTPEPRTRPSPRRFGLARSLRAGGCLAFLLAACTAGGAEPEAALPSVPTVEAPTTTATPVAAEPVGSVRDARVRLQEVAQLSAPVAMTAVGDDLFVAERSGRVRALRAGQVDPSPVLDITGEVVSGGEQGLLGVAVSPDGKYLYVNFTNRSENTSIREYPLRGGRADAGEGRELMEIEDFAGNHNGGQLAFGPDGKLYIATGDGGGAGDPRRNGQKLSSLLGKILRIDPRPVGGREYGVPADNPFVGRDGARAEIWAYGLRNPWRFSFDPANGDLWIGDVGQNAWEEIDVIPAGRGGLNFGWSLREGKHPYPPGGSQAAPRGAVDPVLEYGRDDGCTVIGGGVYRGQGIAALRGAYLYGDYCSGWVRAVATRGGKPRGAPVDLGVEVQQLSSFGTDSAGEVYLLSVEGGVYRLMG